jgi:hypothetical protein
MSTISREISIKIRFSRQERINVKFFSSRFRCNATRHPSWTSALITSQHSRHFESTNKGVEATVVLTSLDASGKEEKCESFARHGLRLTMISRNGDSAL